MYLHYVLRKCVFLLRRAGAECCGGLRRCGVLWWFAVVWSVVVTYGGVE